MPAVDGNSEPNVLVARMVVRPWRWSGTIGPAGETLKPGRGQRSSLYDWEDGAVVGISEVEVGAAVGRGGAAVGRGMGAARWWQPPDDSGMRRRVFLGEVISRRD
jgi:hypothetical protein